MDQFKTAIIGAIRFSAVFVAGHIIALVLQLTGVDLTQWGDQIEDAFTLFFMLVYYVAIRVGSKWQPMLELFLIAPKGVVYVNPVNLPLAKRNTKNL